MDLVSLYFHGLVRLFPRPIYAHLWMLWMGAMLTLTGYRLDHMADAPEPNRENFGVIGLSALGLVLFILVFHLSKAERRRELFQPPVPAPGPWFAVLCALIAVLASGVTLYLWFA